MSKVVHFSVYVDDAPRAQAFYSGVFGWRFEAWGPPGFWRVFTPGAAHGLSEGAMSQRVAPRGQGEPNAFRCSISVADLDATIAAVQAHGGALRLPVAEIPGVGRVVEFDDTEGNRVCAMQYVPGDPRAEAP